MIGTSGINVANCYKQYGNTVDALKVRHDAWSIIFVRSKSNFIFIMQIFFERTSNFVV